MTWRDATFRELFTVKHGYAFQGEFFDSTGEYVLLTPGNFREEGGFKEQVDKRKYYTGEIPDGFILKRGDLLVVMTEQAPGLLGSSAWIPASGRFLHNQRLGLITQLNDLLIDKSFLYYLFNTVRVRHQISSSASGTKVRHTSPERIGRVMAALPPIITQRRIAAILSAYDDLIGNNRRRIQLLEQAARLIYQEWFVRLRYPGHEHARVVDGVPEGWERTPLSEALLLQRGFDLPAANRREGIVPILASTGITGTHDSAKVRGPGVVTGRSGSLGVVTFVDKDFWPLNTALWVKEFKRVSPYYAYFMLSEMGLEQYNGGASVPTLDRKAVHRVPVLIPSPALVQQFDEHVQPIFRQKKTLNQMSTALRTARDLLLPKLMSGEIEV